MSSSIKLSAVTLIVSDTAFADPSTDRGNQAIADVFREHGAGQWQIVAAEIVPDSLPDIQKAVKKFCDQAPASGDFEFPNVLITTGGTGFATRDVTPEAVEPMLDRKAPGLVHAMLAKSLEITPFAMMSRPVAGVRGKTLIVTLPGSPKGAKENLQTIMKLLPHACLQIAGMDSRVLHTGGMKKLEQDAGLGNASPSKSQHDSSHHHHHHHHEHGHAMPRAHTKPEDHPESNDPSAGPSRRHRASPYPMLSVTDAVSIILEHTPSPRTTTVPVDLSLIGRILAEDVVAEEAVPAFRASIVDGYAVIAAKDAPSTKGVFPVASISHASPGDIQPLKTGQITRITTGAPLPPGATAVVMVEDTVLKSKTEDGKEEREVEILTDDIQPGENVREIGSDIKAGETILRKGEKISAIGGELGLLASVGRAEVLVYEKPIVGVLSTGDEIVNHTREGPLKLGEVRDCNRPTVMAVVRGWGYETFDLGIARDAPGSLESLLRGALRQVDIIITTGGVSMGELDLLKPTLERSLDGTIHFGRVAMKPGKPTTFATVNYKDNKGHRAKKLVFSLPGNPASAVVTASLFVLPSLMKSSGESESASSTSTTGTKGSYLGLPRTMVVLDEDVRCDKVRQEYQRAILSLGEDGVLRAITTGGQRSSRVGSFRSANGLLVLPAGGGIVEKGKKVEALLMGSIEW